MELYDQFSEECRFVIEAFTVIYHNDNVARDAEMSAEARLALHQSQSKPTMDNLHAWLRRQLNDKLVEPNSALGDAINYLLKRWEPLTLFPRKAGAPLDNNLCERALKKAIMHRKNLMFYKTRNGARVGDMYMSVIYTCELSGVSAFDYLNQLQLNATDITKSTDRWMPWNYLDNASLFPTRGNTQHSKSARHRIADPSRRILLLMVRKTIEIQLTPEERSLMLRYGYPFEQIEQALKACESSREIEIVPMDRFELERLIEDMCRSIK